MVITPTCHVGKASSILVGSAKFEGSLYLGKTISTCEEERCSNHLLRAESIRTRCVIVSVH